MNIYRYTLNRESHSRYNYLKDIDFSERENYHNYNDFRLLSELSKNYFGTSTDKLVKFNFQELMNADLIILVGESYVGDNVEDDSEYYKETFPRYKYYQDIILPTSVFGDSFLLTGTFLEIPTIFVATKHSYEITRYGNFVSKPPYYIVSHKDSIMDALKDINLKKDAKVFIIATDKSGYSVKLTNSVLKQVEKELKLYAHMID
jgi:hypothetical protein